jgi:tRNA(Ile)-lysidine synthase
LGANNDLFSVFSECLIQGIAASGCTPKGLAVGVSGGADSMALALLAQQWAHAHNLSLATYTVDHQLRPESADESAQVHAWLGARGIAHRTLIWAHDAIDGNLHEAARIARYRLLSQAAQADGFYHLLVAHHQDDQAETVLANLVRGSGVDGLSAMPLARELTQDVWLMRPLLSIPKSALIAYCETQNQCWIEDPSNHAERFTRTLLRQLLATFVPQGLSAARLADVAQNMQRARAALEYAAQQAWDACIQREELSLRCDRLAFIALPEELQLRVLARLQQTLQPTMDRPRMESLMRLRTAIDSGTTTRMTLGGCVWKITQSMITCAKE